VTIRGALARARPSRERAIRWAVFLGRPTRSRTGSSTAIPSRPETRSTSRLFGRRAAVEADAVSPQAHTRPSALGRPDPYRGHRAISDRLRTGIESQPPIPGTHIDSWACGAAWRIRIYTVAGDLVAELHSDIPGQRLHRRAATDESGQPHPGWNRQQDSTETGERAGIDLAKRTDVVSRDLSVRVDSHKVRAGEVVWCAGGGRATLDRAPSPLGPRCRGDGIGAVGRGSDRLSVLTAERRGERDSVRRQSASSISFSATAAIPRSSALASDPARSASLHDHIARALLDLDRRDARVLILQRI